MTFALFEMATWQFIGVTQLLDINHQHRSAEFGKNIGDPNARGKGYGTEATRLTLDHAFLALGLQCVMLRYAAFTTADIRAHEKAGFKHVGRIRQYVMMGGKPYAVVLMDIVAEEFASAVLSRVLAPDESRGEQMRQCDTRWSYFVNWNSA